MNSESFEPTDPSAIIGALMKASSGKYRDNLQKFAINPGEALGVPVPEIRKIAKGVLPGRSIALELWSSGVHEAMILATMVFPPNELTLKEASNMLKEIRSWDLCDHFTGNLVANSTIAIRTIADWLQMESEFERRAAFSTIAQLDRRKFYTAENVKFFFNCIRKAATDDRNFVKKAVLWAILAIGKTCREYNSLTILVAKEISGMDSKPAKWIAGRALKELTSGKVAEHLEKLPCP